MPVSITCRATAHAGGSSASSAKDAEDSEDGLRGWARVDDSPALDDGAGRPARALERALRRLPDHQRVPLVLFHFEDTSYQDIAVALGVSLGKVKTDIHRGREALKKRLSSTTMNPVDAGNPHRPGAAASFRLPRAPHTLLPRVLAAVQAWAQRPWYERAWFTWPLGGKSRRSPR